MKVYGCDAGCHILRLSGSVAGSPLFGQPTDCFEPFFPLFYSLSLSSSSPPPPSFSCMPLAEAEPALGIYEFAVREGCV